MLLKMPHVSLILNRWVRLEAERQASGDLIGWYTESVWCRRPCNGPRLLLVMVSPTRSFQLKDRIRIFADMSMRYTGLIWPLFVALAQHIHTGCCPTRSLAAFPSPKPFAENGLEFNTQVNSAVASCVFFVFFFKSGSRFLHVVMCFKYLACSKFKQSLEAVTYGVTPY